MEIFLEPENPFQKLPNSSIIKIFRHLFRFPFSSTKNLAKKRASLNQDSDMAENSPAYVETRIIVGINPE